MLKIKKENGHGAPVISRNSPPFTLQDMVWKEKKTIQGENVVVVSSSSRVLIYPYGDLEAGALHRIIEETREYDASDLVAVTRKHLLNAESDLSYNLKGLYARMSSYTSYAVLLGSLRKLYEEINVNQDTFVLVSPEETGLPRYS